MQPVELNDAEKMIKILCIQNAEQLKEMFHCMLDVGGLESVVKLFDAAEQFLNEHDPEGECCTQHDEDDYLDVDESMRAREANAINNGRF